MSEQASNYEKLAAINVNKYVEKKNGLNFLSWAWAVDQLMRNDPQATWEYKSHQQWGDTVMVFCAVTAFGKTMTAQLPVMDYKNKAIHSPDAFQINTAMQRCLAKAIALHGLGLYIYAGEDLPEDEKEAEKPAKSNPAPTASKPVAVDAFERMPPEEQQFLREQHAIVMESDNPTAMYKTITDTFDADEKVAFWSLFDSKQRAAIKAGAK